MATNMRVGLDNYALQIRKNPSFDFDRKHLREEAKRSRGGNVRDEKSGQESFSDVLARVATKRL